MRKRKKLLISMTGSAVRPAYLYYTEVLAKMKHPLFRQRKEKPRVLFSYYDHHEKNEVRIYGYLTRSKLKSLLYNVLTLQETQNVTIVEGNRCGRKVKKG